VFTPYKRAWLAALTIFTSRPIRSTNTPPPWRRAGADERVPSLAEIGFEPTNLAELGIACGMAGGRKLFDDF
jgi:deoxyribodipyrimidine photo-lyase